MLDCILLTLQYAITILFCVYWKKEGAEAPTYYLLPLVSSDIRSVMKPNTPVSPYFVSMMVPTTIAIAFIIIYFKLILIIKL